MQVDCFTKRELWIPSNHGRCQFVQSITFSQQVKLYNPKTRRNREYLTGKHPYPEISFCFCFVSRTTWCSYLVSTTLKSPPGYLQCIAGCFPVCQALSAAQGQLGAALISFADPGGQCSEVGRGKWGLTESSLYSATASSLAGRGGVGMRRRVLHEFKIRDRTGRGYTEWKTCQSRPGDS